MEYIDFFNTIEKYYFNEDYQSVVNLYEKYARVFRLNYSREYDFKIVEAIATSYREIGKPSNSLSFIDQQINYLSNKKSLNSDEKESLKYNLICKINILGTQGSSLKEYKMINMYFKSTRELNEQLLLGRNNIEEILYQKLLYFNKTLGHIIVFFIILAIICHLVDYQINKTLYCIYNITTLIGIIWLLINHYFRVKIKSLFIKSLRIVFD